EAWRELVATKNLSDQSFSSISLNRSSQFTRSSDAQSANRQIVREGEHRQIAAGRSNATIVNLLIFGSPADTFVRPEPRHVVSRRQAPGFGHQPKPYGSEPERHASAGTHC